MKIDKRTVTRPATRYFGAKWRLAPWLIPYIPNNHRHYIDVFGGAASVLLRKERSPIETYNDIQERVVGFFQVLRDRPNEFIRSVVLTPWSRKEFDDLAFEMSGDPIEDARRFWMSTYCNISGSNDEASAYISMAKSGNSSRSKTVFSLPESLYAIAERLRGVQIENLDYRVLLKKYDADDAFIYADPPYVHSTRNATNRYDFEWSDDDHRESADVFNSLKGMVMVSGYDSDLYRELYESVGWKRVETSARINGGRKLMESIWLSPSLVDALGDESDPTLFSGDG